LKRLPMEMVKMRMGHQDEIDWRQVPHMQAGLPQALQEEQPARKIRIDDYALPADLQEKARMSDEGEAQFAVCCQARLVCLSGAWRHCGMSHQSGELAGPLAQSRISK